MTGSWIDVWGITYDTYVTVTIKTGEKYHGRIINAPNILEGLPLKDLVLQLEPQYGRGNHHKILADQIIAVTRNIE